MKNIFDILFIFCCTFLFAQKQQKTDTITFVYNKTAYDSIARIFVKKMIESNNLHVQKKGKNEYLHEVAYIGDLDGLEIISHPIYSFKKSIINDNGKNNLVQYIDFINDPYEQNFDIFYKKDNKYIWTFTISKEKFNKIMTAEGLNNDENLFYIHKKPIRTMSPPYVLYKPYFSCYIDDQICALIENRIFVIKEDIYTTSVEEFNYYFYPYLNPLKLKAQNLNYISYETQERNLKIPLTYLKIVYK